MFKSINCLHDGISHDCICLGVVCVQAHCLFVYRALSSVMTSIKPLTLYNASFIYRLAVPPSSMNYVRLIMSNASDPYSVKGNDGNTTVNNVVKDY